MNLREALSAEHSKSLTIELAAEVGNSRKRFRELLAIVCDEDQKIAPRAAWVVRYCAESNPRLVQEFLKQLLENLRRPNLHDGLKRNTMRAICDVEIPEDIAGLAADVSFTFLSSPDEAVATKVCAMVVLATLCEQEPTLVGELRMAIEQQLPLNRKPAFRSRANHVLKALDAIDPET